MNNDVRRYLFRKLKAENCLWSYDLSKMKSIAPQGAMYRWMNVLYAWYYFGAKRPEAYVKSIETRHMNRLAAA